MPSERSIEIARMVEAGHTLAEVGKVFGISHQRVGQIVAKLTPQALPREQLRRECLAMVGMRFGRLTVVGMPDCQGRARLDVVCDCGEKRQVRPSHLRGGRMRSCGCLGRESFEQARVALQSALRRDRDAALIGQRFGYLTLVEVHIGRDVPASFRCDCGNLVIKRLGNVVHNRTKSCVSEECPYSVGMPGSGRRPGPNGMARKVQIRTTSFFKGVHWFARRRMWTARLRSAHRGDYFLGYFDSEAAAARAYDQCAVAVYGLDKAMTNERMGLFKKKRHRA